jgi:hypothetical protein
MTFGKMRIVSKSHANSSKKLGKWRKRDQTTKSVEIDEEFSIVGTTYRQNAGLSILPHSAVVVR